MAARTKPAPSPSKPKYAIVDEKFVAQTDAGEVKVPLRVKTKLVRHIRDLPGDDIDQLFALLDGIGDTRTPAVLDELDIIETTRLALEFFQMWAAYQGASLGESMGSSTSSRSTEQLSDSTSGTSSDSGSTSTP